MAGRGEGDGEGQALSYDELYERLVATYPSISLDDLYDSTPNEGHPLGVTNARVIMLMAQSPRRRQRELVDLAEAVRAGMSDAKDISALFPVPPDPALADEDERPADFVSDEWWRGEQ